MFPTLPTNIPRSIINASIMPDKVNIPRSAQLIGTVEHALTPNVAVSASVIYTKSWNKEYTYDTNLQWNGIAWVRPDPNYRSLSQIRYEAPADYREGFVEITKRAGAYGFKGNITVARSYETGVAANGIAGTIDDQQCGIRCDYGPAPDVPRVRGLLSGWYNVGRAVQLSGIFRARTGLAFNPIASGLDLNGDGVFGDRTPGLAPYSFRGPGMNSLDARVAWMLPVGGSRRLQVFLESFNALNRANIATVNNNYGPNAAQPLASWMQPTVYFPPREIQLGVSLNF